MEMEDKDYKRIIVDNMNVKAENVRLKEQLRLLNNLQKPQFDYIKCPLHRYTFSVKNIRDWVENNCEGKTLNLFAGKTKLNIDEIRNDLDIEALADYRLDALELLRTWQGEKFDTVLLDPPYAYRKSMEMYKGIRCSPFKQLKDEITRILKPNGIVITFGYHSNAMGKNRGFEVERIALFSHGGAIHDTIASVERFKELNKLSDYSDSDLPDKNEEGDK